MSSQANAKISPTGDPMVAQAAAGDRDAFAIIYNEHRDSVYRFLLKRTRNSDLAEDLTQDVFARALRSIGTFAERTATGGVGGWLYTIARNIHIDHCRSGRTRLEMPVAEFHDVDERYVSAENNALRDLEAIEAAANVQAALTSLNPYQRRCIELRYIDELSVEEVAVALGKPTGAVKTLAFRSLRRMAIALTSEEVAA